MIAEALIKGIIIRRPKIKIKITTGRTGTTRIIKITTGRMRMGTTRIIKEVDNQIKTKVRGIEKMGITEVKIIREIKIKETGEVGETKMFKMEIQMHKMAIKNKIRVKIEKTTEKTIKEVNSKTGTIQKITREIIKQTIVEVKIKEGEGKGIKTEIQIGKMAVKGKGIKAEIQIGKMAVKGKGIKTEIQIAKMAVKGKGIKTEIHIAKMAVKVEIEVPTETKKIKTTIMEVEGAIMGIKIKEKEVGDIKAIKVDKTAKVQMDKTIPETAKEIITIMQIEGKKVGVTILTG
jgi:hypothetical protein